MKKASAKLVSEWKLKRVNGEEDCENKLKMSLISGEAKGKLA